MKVAICISLFMIVLSCISCKNDISDDQNNQFDFTKLEDVENAILGKWEFVLATGSVHGTIEHKPAGYVEYLPNGHFAWYDYATKKYILYEGKYWIDKNYEWSNTVYQIDKGWILHYENPRVFSEVFGEEIFMYEYYPDKPHGNQLLFQFINRDTHSLFCIDLAPSIMKLPDFIYKRKK